MDKKARLAARTHLYLLVVAGVIVVGNALSYGLHRRFDLTRNERFTLSPGSARLVREDLEQPLEIDFYVTGGSSKQQALIEDVTELLREYERVSDGKLHYSVIEPKTDAERDAAKAAGLEEIAIGENSETAQDQSTITRGFMGIAFSYGAERVAIPALSPDRTDGLEFWISNKIREVRARAQKSHVRVGVVTGMDEVKLTEASLAPAEPGQAPGPTMKAILGQIAPQCEIDEVDLHEGKGPIDRSLAGLVVTQPGRDFTEMELRRIDEFLMLGNKALAVFASAVNLKAGDGSMRAELTTHGIERLLDGYGVEMKKDAVLDWGGSLTIPVPTQSGQTLWFRAPGILQSQHDGRLAEDEQLLDSTFVGFFRIDEIAFPFPSTLVPHPEKQPDAAMRVVARSTPRATVETSDRVEMRISSQWKPKGDYAPRAIAIDLEGKLRSAFPNGAGDRAVSDGPSRLLVISASNFLVNPFARSGNPPPGAPQAAALSGLGGDRDLQMLAQPYAQKYVASSIVAMRNILDWMTGDSDLVAASAKLLGETNLTYSDIRRPPNEADANEGTTARAAEAYRSERGRVQRRVQTTLTVVPSLLFAAFGVLRWRSRDRARARRATR